MSERDTLEQLLDQQAPEKLAEALVRLNDEDWETWDGRTISYPVEEWPPGARDLRDAIAALVRLSQSPAARV